MPLTGGRCLFDGRLHADHDRAMFMASKISFSRIVTAFENGNGFTWILMMSSLLPTELRPAMESFANEDDTIGFRWL
jgi:hypothetical protein